MTTTGIPAPALTAPARSIASVLHAHIVRAGSAIARGVITAWRYWRSALAAIRLGLMWSTFCANTGLALRRVRTDEHGSMRISIDEVPRLSRVRLSAHGWTVRVRLRPGQHLDQFGQLSVALRHAARAQTVKAVELPDRPGYLELRILRRDPLIRVTEQPRELAAGRLATGSAETGEPMVLDFDVHPHYLLCGATGSGNTKHVLWHT
jgi:hypothetical protein